jgi:hypothetical protein
MDISEVSGFYWIFLRRKFAIIAYDHQVLPRMVKDLVDESPRA